MKYKIFLFSTIFLLLILSSMNLVLGATSANATVNKPASGGSMTGGTYAYNCTVDNSTANNENYTSVRVWLVSAGKTANTTEFLATAYVLNSSSKANGGMSLNGTLNTSRFEDGNDYTFKCEISNGTDTINKTQTATIDNTVPIIPSITSHSDNQVINTAGTETFSYTVTDSKTTSCTYTVYRDNSAGDTKSSSGSGTYSGSTCSFTKAFSDSTDNGNWYIASTASDETNTTASTLTLISVQFPGTGGGGSSLPPIEPTYGFLGIESNAWLWVIIGLIAVIVISIVVFALKK